MLIKRPLAFERVCSKPFALLMVATKPTRAFTMTSYQMQIQSVLGLECPVYLPAFIVITTKQTLALSVYVVPMKSEVVHCGTSVVAVSILALDRVLVMGVDMLPAVVSVSMTPMCFISVCSPTCVRTRF
jgi:hypothetical protein